jgi:hypothetical protein
MGCGMHGKKLRAVYPTALPSKFESFSTTPALPSIRVLKEGQYPRKNENIENEIIESATRYERNRSPRSPTVFEPSIGNLSQTASIYPRNGTCDSFGWTGWHRANRFGI